MKKFEIGHTYFDRYACDYETLSVIKIVKRTAKTVVFERNGETRRALLREDSNGEYIIPDHYSMACVYRADSEIVDGVPNDELDVYETDEAEEAPESLENAPVEAEKPEAGKVIYFPAQARKQPEGRTSRRRIKSPKKEEPAPLVIENMVEAEGDPFANPEPSESDDGEDTGGDAE